MHHKDAGKESNSKLFLNIISVILMGKFKINSETHPALFNVFDFYLEHYLLRNLSEKRLNASIEHQRY